jgi:hypothetical protein
VLKIAALILASAAGSMAAAASTDTSSTLVPNAPWWEKVTVTMDGAGQPEACRYETSLVPASAQACDVDSPDAATATKASDNKSEVTQITFERRFSPGAAPAKPQLATGDTLLGGQVMALAIVARGSVKGCRIVSRAGSVQPDYGCSEASAERFQASLGDARPAPREGYMTIIVYGHSEHQA